MKYPSLVQFDFKKAEDDWVSLVSVCPRWRLDMTHAGSTPVWDMRAISTQPYCTNPDCSAQAGCWIVHEFTQMGILVNLHAELMKCSECGAYFIVISTSLA